MDFKAWVSLSALFFEGAGVAIMVVGTIVSFVMVLIRYRRGGGEHAFRSLREKVGRSILLGLELLVAADIIRTVSRTVSEEKQPLDEVLAGVFVLGLIVLIRTFLSFTLAVELEGHWPWKSAEIRGLHEQGRLAPPEPRAGPGVETKAPEQHPPRSPEGP